MNSPHKPAQTRHRHTVSIQLMVGALLATAMHVAAAQPSKSTAAATRAAALDGARTMTLHGPRAAALAELTAQAVQPLEELGAEPRPPALDAAALDPETRPSAAAEPDREAPAASTEEGGGLRLDLDLDLDTPIEPRADGPTQPAETATEGSAPAAPAPPPTESPAPPVSAPPLAPTETPAPPVAAPAAVDSAPPASAAPTAPVTQPAPPVAPPDASDGSRGGQPGIVRIQPPPRGGLPIWAYLLGAALLLAVLVAAVVLLLRRRRGAPGPVAPTRASAPRAPAPAAPAAAARATVAPPAPVPERPAAAPAGARPLAVLRDLSGTTDQAEHPISAAVVQIGRAESELEGVQSVVVQKKTVGRRHAVIEFRNHTYWLVDQGSLNGTYVNGDRVAGEVALRPGARISLESAEFEFVMPGLDMNATMVASSIDEFSETLVAPSIAGAPPAPGRQTRSAADEGVDARDDTARPAEKEAIAAAAAAGTVDFDVLGEADPEPAGKVPDRRG